MHYSCFDQAAGVYDYFEDGLQHPINADLPVPGMPSPTRIGVAAIEAGRPLPPSAQYVGRGWHARGQIVNCRGGSLSGLGDSVVSGFGIAAGVVLFIVVGSWAYKKYGRKLA